MEEYNSDNETILTEASSIYPCTQSLSQNVNDVPRFASKGFAFFAYQDHNNIKRILRNAIVENSKLPIEHRVVFDLDGLMIQYMKTFSKKEIHRKYQAAYLETHYPSSTIIEYMDVYYVIYPEFDLLILTILSWKGWSVDFFSAGSFYRNYPFIVDFMRKALSDTNSYKMQPLQIYSDETAFLAEPNPLYDALRKSGRLQSLSGQQIITRTLPKNNMINRLKSRCDVAKHSIPWKTDDEMLQAMSDSYDVKDLRYIVQTKDELASGLGSTDHIILIDDCHGYSHPAQRPYLHVNSQSISKFHDLVPELDWVGEQIDTFFFQDNNSLDKEMIDKYIKQWNPASVKENYELTSHDLYDALYLHYHTHAAYNNPELPISTPQYEFSPLYNSLYILGILKDCKDLISKTTNPDFIRMPLREALHQVLLRDKKSKISYPHKVDEQTELNAFDAYASTYYAIDTVLTDGDAAFRKFYNKKIKQGYYYLSVVADFPVPPMPQK